MRHVPDAPMETEAFQFIEGHSSSSAAGAPVRPSKDAPGGEGADDIDDIAIGAWDIIICCCISICCCRVSSRQYHGTRCADQCLWL